MSESVYFQLSRYVQPVLIVFGTIGVIFNLLLFHFRKQLRSNSCAFYFRALSCNDLLVLWIIIFPQWFRTQFPLDSTTEYNWYCKLNAYLTYVLYNISPYFIVLACFDRFCTSSTHAALRRIAKLQVAMFLVSCVIAFIFLLHLYVPIHYEIISTDYGTFCAMANSTYNRLLSFSVVIFFCLIPPLLMIIFCSITLFLLRQQRHRIMPVNQKRLRHRDQQILKMLIIYVTWNITSIAPFTVTYVREVYMKNNLTPLSSSTVQFFALLVDVTYASSFYVYTLGTPFYRDELYELVKHFIQYIYQTQRRLQHLPIAQITSNAT